MEETKRSDAGEPREGRAATRLRRDAPAILDEWATRVRAEVPAARETWTPALYDHLPHFLQALAEALKPESPLEHACEASRICELHGEQRARGTEYTLGQVLREYHLLHRTLVERLEASGPLTDRERWVILDSIHHAIQEAATRFAEVHREEEAESSRRKDEFLAILGHELRNPLGAITNALHLLESCGSPEPAPQRLRTVASRQVAHLTRLVEDLLDLSRVARGKIQLRRERIDLAQAAAHAAQTARPWFEERSHQLVLDLGEEELWVEADAVRLEQILTNLLNNAAKYTPPGGTIDLRVRPETPQEAVVRVRDNGIGIQPENLSRIFEMFTQADSPSDRAQAGLGIGLALVRYLVELHGGTVDACSEGPGKGAEFVVRLPRARASAD